MNIERNHIEWYRAYYRQQYKLNKNHRQYLSEMRKYRNLANAPISVEVNPILIID
jgi:hypothetical protein